MGRIGQVIQRDLADGIEFVDEDWIAADQLNATGAERLANARAQIESELAEAEAA